MNQMPYNSNDNSNYKYNKNYECNCTCNYKYKIQYKIMPYLTLQYILMSYSVQQCNIIQSIQFHAIHINFVIFDVTQKKRLEKVILHT